jgi:uncharacterized protein (TIGR00251 family)
MGMRTDIVRKEPGRLLVSLRVTPRASRDELTLEDGILRIYVKAAPVEGAANEAVIALLAGRLRVPKRDVTLVHGATVRNKVIAVAGLSVVELWERLGI